MKTSPYSVVIASAAIPTNKVIFRTNINTYLTKIEHSTEELQFHIQPSRLLVEEPPQTTGKILLRKKTKTTKSTNLT